MTICGIEKYYSEKNFYKKIGTSTACPYLEEPNGLDDAFVPKARYRKRLVVKQRRYECVYKRIADLNVTFCEKGGTAKQVTDFFA